LPRTAIERIIPSLTAVCVAAVAGVAGAGAADVDAAGGGGASAGGGTSAGAGAASCASAGADQAPRMLPARSIVPALLPILVVLEITRPAFS